MTIDLATGEITSTIQEFIVLAHIDINAVPDDWESLVGVGQEIGRVHDTDRWALGDIGHHKIARLYGEEGVKRYADAINLGRSTFYQYIETSSFFELSMRLDFFDTYPQLCWSHYYQVQRTGQMKFAAGILKVAAARSWSARGRTKRAVEMLIKHPAPPKKLTAIEGTLEEIAAALTRASLDGLFPGPLRITVAAMPKPKLPKPKSPNVGRVIRP